MAIIYPSIATGDFASTKTANNFSGSQTISGNLNVTGSQINLTSSELKSFSKDGIYFSLKTTGSTNDAGYQGAQINAYPYTDWCEIDLISRTTSSDGGIWLEVGPNPWPVHSASLWLQNNGVVELYGQNTDIISQTIRISGSNTTISGALTTTGSIFSLNSNTRSQLKVTDERLDLIVTGSRVGGTQILLDATNAAGAAQILGQATNDVVLQAGSASANYPYYFHADAANKFTALEADDVSGAIYVGGSGYGSSVNIGTSGSRIIAVGNTSSATSIDIKAGIAGTTITGSLIITGSVKTNLPMLIGSLATVNSSAILEMSSSNKGVLFPRVTGANRASMTGVTGLLVYQTDISGSDGEGLYIYKSTGWVQII